MALLKVGTKPLGRQALQSVRRDAIEQFLGKDDLQEVKRHKPEAIERLEGEVVWLRSGSPRSSGTVVGLTVHGAMLMGRQQAVCTLSPLAIVGNRRREIEDFASYGSTSQSRPHHVRRNHQCDRQQVR